MTETEFVDSVNLEIAKAYEKDNDSLKHRCLETLTEILNEKEYRSFLINDLQFKIYDIRSEVMMYHSEMQKEVVWARSENWLCAKNKLERYFSALDYAKGKKSAKLFIFLDVVLETYPVNIGRWVHDFRLGSSEITSVFCYTLPIPQPTKD